MKKETARKISKFFRAVSPTAELLEKSLKIQERLLSLKEYKKAKTICTYISKEKEVFTHNLLNIFLNEGKEVVIPITDVKKGILKLSKISYDFAYHCRMGPFGIMEPEIIKEISPSELDLILVPGVAFDINGGRVGYGKGYYDKLLEKVNCPKVGLCFDFQIFKRISLDEWDVRMDIVVSDKRILYF